MSIRDAVIGSPTWCAWLRKEGERRLMEQTPTCVYLISDGSKVKIGVSVQPQKRLKQLQGANAERLTLLRLIECENRDKAMELESALHEKLWANNVRGEWYDIHELCAVLEIPESTD